mgnify:FL=1
MQYDETIDDVSFWLLPGLQQQIHITTDNMSKPWLAVDMVLNDLEIDRDTVESTVYEYVYDKKKGRMIKCVVTLKKSMTGMLLGNLPESKM